MFKRYMVSVLGSSILAFGLYHVHSFSGITEGGILGMTLLLQHWLHLSPAITGFIMNTACYALGWRVLGREFIKLSMVATAAFSASYAIFEQFPPLWPQLGEHQLVAAILGALFVGVGVGICIRAGSAPTGDDSLAMTLSQIVRVKIQWVYLISDLIVLGLSLSYIPAGKLLYSLLTVVISGQVIGWVQNFKLPPKKK